MDISFLREREPVSTLTVTELNSYIKNILDNNKTLAAVSVTGEISNLKDHGSGHLYFSLKDTDAQIKAVMFRFQRGKLRFMPEDGMRVTVFGSVSVYSQTGTVQIYVNSMEPDGIGSLYLAYEQLKEKLLQEGLFDDAHKKLLPLYPRRIGVITSPSGAAVRDIINVTKRRFPIADIYVYPALVQGDGAVPSLIKALDYFEETKLADLVIIGRGGGSIEDLWAFNSEKLARRVYDFSIPIISAVGHETDFTICDFVADMRAPTPSAAAEISVPDRRELFIRLGDIEARLRSFLVRCVETKREKLSLLEKSPSLSDSSVIFESRREQIAGLYNDAHRLCKALISNLRADMAVLAGKSEAMSPLSVLKRGYSLCENEQGKNVNVENLKVGDNLKIILSDGNIGASVTSVNKEQRN